MSRTTFWISDFSKIKISQNNLIPALTPEGAQEGSGAPWGQQWRCQHYPQRAPSAPLGLQEASGSALEGIWASFSSFGGLFFSHFQAISNHHASIIKQQSSLIDHHSSLVNHLNDQHQSSMIIIDHHWSSSINDHHQSSSTNNHHQWSMIIINHQCSIIDHQRPLWHHCLCAPRPVWHRLKGGPAAGAKPSDIRRPLL